MKTIEQTGQGWRIRGGDLVLDVDRKTGSLAQLTIQRGKPFVWSSHPGEVAVRDDYLKRTFGTAELRQVRGRLAGGTLTIEKQFRGAPWRLVERYRVGQGAIAWESEVILDAGPFRSCAVSYRVPWPSALDDFFGISFWAAKDGMPSAPHRFASVAFEYGEVTSGVLIPALSSYIEKRDAGLLLYMPFDFKTPRVRWISGYRDPALQTEFDWLALAPGRPARTALGLRGTPGNWRPALGWLYETYRDYFEPRSTLIHDLWGGHISGECDVTPAQARRTAALSLRWHEIHRHFPAYGNYHPEGMDRWKTGHHPHQFNKWITVDMVRRTIRNLHAAGAAALPYIQVTGDGAATGPARAFPESMVRDRRGQPIYSAYYDIFQMNADPSLPFGRDITRQIHGMVERYPDMDGVFLDQACYNFIDTAHDDGITAIDNRPVYLTGFNYAPHLELLSSLLHPGKVIIGNGPFSIGVMRYLDGYMAEGSGWLCDHLQYYGIGSKPMFFLLYHTTDRDIELMFQRCLLYGAGFSSYPAAMKSKDLYDRYLPLIRRLYGRRWVFDARPLDVPTGYRGQVFQHADGRLNVSVISEEPRLDGRRVPDQTVCVRTAGADAVRRVTLQQPGGRAVKVRFGRENGAVSFKLPGRAIAAVAELS